MKLKKSKLKNQIYVMKSKTGNNKESQKLTFRS